MFIGKWNKSVILTYLGLVFDVLGISYGIIYDNAIITIICLMLAGVCDMFDGYVARKCKRDEREILFGIELDSLVDVVSFIVLPIIIYIILDLISWVNILSFILLSICGIARLAYYNVYTANKDGEIIKCYEGLPVTVAAITFPLFYLLIYVLPLNIFNIVFTILAFLEAFLNIFRFKIKKPSGKIYIVMSILAIIFLIVFGVLFFY